MCRQHAEVLRARVNFEILMEQQAMNNAIAPPPALKQQIMNAVLPGEARIIPITTGKPVLKTNWFKWVASACALVLVGSLYWNIAQYSRNRKLQASYNDVVSDYDSTVLRLS